MRLGAAGAGPVSDQEPALPPLRVIRLARSQAKLVYRTLGWIKDHTGTSYQTVALELCCADYVSTYHPSDPVPAPATAGGSTRAFRFRPHPDQMEVIAEALALACAPAGARDQGAALTHVCAVFAARYIDPARPTT